MSRFNFSNLSPNNPLLILDLANNHNGSLSHGKKIIEEIAKLQNPSNFPIAVKFQYRDLPNFIHPDFRNRRDLKYVDRFLSTQLSWDAFEELKNYASSLGLLTACTPFDEFSVSKVKEHGFDILKIASASFTDWGLLESLDNWDGPIVASTAGVSQFEIDRVVAFLSNREKDFALMHCVAAYPTLDSDLILHRISKMRDRYVGIPVGYSTHENPANMVAAPLALAKGAVILERHVGLGSEEFSLNLYSSEVARLNSWINSLEAAIQMMGPEDPWSIENKSEKESLAGLRRYIFAREQIPKGTKITNDLIFFGIPGDSGKVQANDFGKYENFVAREDIPKGSAITWDAISRGSTESKILEIRDAILQMIHDSKVSVPQNSILEISHHYGLENFAKFGTCMITVINRDYCKKLLFLLPGQTHPPMYHKTKDETFFLLYGDMRLKLNHEYVSSEIGEIAVIPPGTIHEMYSEGGAIIEEVSSTHVLDDSFYLDQEINRNNSRKVYVQYWI